MGEQEAVIVMEKERNNDGSYSYSALNQAEDLLSMLNTDQSTKNTFLVPRESVLDSIMTKGEDSTSDVSYVKVQKDVVGLVRLSRDIEREVSSRTPSKRLTNSLRWYFAENFSGRKRYGIDEMLAMQLKHLDSLTATLKKVIEQNRTELEDLREYHVGLTEEYFDTIINREEGKVSLELIVETYDAVKTEFNKEKEAGLRKTNIKYKQFVTTLMKLEQQLSDYDTSQDLSTQQVMLRGQEEGYLRTISQLSTISLNTSMELCQTAESIRTHIQNTIKLYGNNYKMQQIVGGAAKAIGHLTAYVATLNRIAGNGLEDMYAVTTQMSGNKSFYNTGISSLKDRVDDIEKAYMKRNTERNQHVDDLVAE